MPKISALNELAAQDAVGTDTLPIVHANATYEFSLFSIWNRAWKGEVNIRQFSAAADGTTNDTAALQAAAATGKDIVVPRNTPILINGTDGGGASNTFAAVKLADGQRIIGENRRSSIIKVAGNGRGVQLGNLGVIENMTFQGPGSSSNLQFNAGIVPYGVGWEIRECDFKDFAGTDSENGGGAVFVLGQTAFSNFKDGSSIIDSDFYTNYTGLNLKARAEFIRVSGGRYLRNGFGIVCRGGNNRFSDLNILENTNGFSLQDGTNEGHGIMVGCTVNHNTKNLIVNNQNIWFLFNASTFAEGSMEISNSQDMRFTGCAMIGAGSLTLTANTGLRATGCYFPQSGADALTKNLVSGSDFTIV